MTLRICEQIFVRNFEKFRKIIQVQILTPKKLVSGITDIEPWYFETFNEANPNVELFIKRDDNTGATLTGNKVRKLEFLLSDALENKADDLKNAGAAVGEFTDKVKGLSGAIGALDDEFNKFGAIARDLDTLHKQMDEVHDFIGKVAAYRQDVDDLAREAEDIIRQGFAPNAREMKDTVSGLQRNLDKLDTKGM